VARARSHTGCPRLSVALPSGITHASGRRCRTSGSSSGRDPGQPEAIARRPASPPEPCQALARGRSVRAYCNIKVAFLRSRYTLSTWRLPMTPCTNRSPPHREKALLRAASRARVARRSALPSSSEPGWRRVRRLFFWHAAPTSREGMCSDAGRRRGRNRSRSPSERLVSI